MDDYKPNSHRFKEEQKTDVKEKSKKLKKVVNGSVKVRKKSHLKEALISEDASNIKSYIVIDVLIPAIKKAISDIVKNGIEMLLYGDSGRRNGQLSPSSSVSYRDYYDRRDDRYRPNPSQRQGRSIDDLVIESRGEAEEVLTRMDELLETYKMVTVADFYDLVGVTCDYTDNNYGWTSLRSAEVVRVRDGYIIKLPRALPIK